MVRSVVVRALVARRPIAATHGGSFRTVPIWCSSVRRISPSAPTRSRRRRAGRRRGPVACSPRARQCALPAASDEPSPSFVQCWRSPTCSETAAVEAAGDSQSQPRLHRVATPAAVDTTITMMLCHSQYESLLINRLLQYNEILFYVDKYFKAQHNVKVRHRL